MMSGPFEGVEEYNKKRAEMRISSVGKYEHTWQESVRLVEKYIGSEIMKLHSEFDNDPNDVNKKLGFTWVSDINRMKINDAINGFLEEAVNECKNDRSIEFAVQAKKCIIKIMGYRLRTIRFTYDMPLKTLASIMGISVSLLDKFEKGNNLEIMQHNYYYKLYFRFNVNLDYLLGLSHKIDQNKHGNDYPMAMTLSDYHDYSYWNYEVYKDIYILLKEIFDQNHSQNDIDEIRSCLNSILVRLNPN